MRVVVGGGGNKLLYKGEESQDCFRRMANGRFYCLVPLQTGRTFLSPQCLNRPGIVFYDTVYSLLCPLSL